MSAEDPTRAVLTQDNRVLIEQPDGSYCPAQSRTDWARVRAMTDDQIEAAAASDPDAPPLDEAFWREARAVVPGQFRKRPACGSTWTCWLVPRARRGSQACMNAVLRAYVEAGSERAGSPLKRVASGFVGFPCSGFVHL